MLGFFNERKLVIETRKAVFSQPDVLGLGEGGGKLAILNLEGTTLQPFTTVLGNTWHATFAKMLLPARGLIL